MFSGRVVLLPPTRMASTELGVNLASSLEEQMEKVAPLLLLHVLSLTSLLRLAVPLNLVRRPLMNTCVPR